MREGGEGQQKPQARCASCGQPLAAGERRHPLGQAGEVEFACALCVGEHDPEAWAAGWESARKEAAHRAGCEAFGRKQAREQAAFVASWAGLAGAVSVPKVEDATPGPEGEGAFEMVQGEGCEMLRQWSFSRVGTEGANRRAELHEPSYRCGLRHADLKAGRPIHLSFPIEEFDAESFAAGLRDGRRRK